MRAEHPKEYRCLPLILGDSLVCVCVYFRESKVERVRERERERERESKRESKEGRKRK